MRKLFALIVIFVLVLAGCWDGDEDDNPNEVTTLSIQNESFSEITDVLWSNVPFTQDTESIKSGYSITKPVKANEGYILFKRKSYPINARTAMLVKVKKNEQKVVVIIDNMSIVDADNPNNTGTFGTLGVTREPQITVQVDDSPIAQYGDYDYGSVLLNTTKDVTFTIGNSGRADLRFNVVEGNVINLSKDTSGYFSVNQQPFATMTIASGSTTTFIIRFSPKTAGNNYNAEVAIATNSENDKEFTFRVKGNGSNEYQVGDSGPGGGTIFFAEGGQYKECSGELGPYFWNEAVNTAKNYKGGGFTNWRLPDRGELDLMYRNRTTIGGFLNTGYWSSVENIPGTAWFQNFSNSSLIIYNYTVSPGGQYYNNKTTSYRVRAVRTYDINTVNPTVDTTLKIKNESSTDITGVIWQGVSFAESTTVNSIKKGTTVTKTVQPGSGYIYFTRSTNPISARTSELVVITKDEQKEFVFSDNTLIVDADNPSNTGTLGSLQPLRTTLTIQNESFSDITDVLWSNIPFTQGAESIKIGTSITKTVQEGEVYIFFKRITNPINARTAGLVKVEKNEQKVIVFTDNTPIADADNPDNTGTFGTLGINKPQITVEEDGSPIAPHGDYDFGSILINTDKDVTFTIWNTGKADLHFNVVEGNVINLSGNTDEYFSVDQQPTATMTIAPGTTTTFIIRFSPKTAGDNFNAEVTISTNSENDKEFTFNVKGTGNNE